MPTVTIHPTGEVIYLDPEETVLSGLYKAGFAYTVGCRRGGCAICKVDCRSGEFSYNHPIADTVITDAERTDGTCLTCRAVPETDVPRTVVRRTAVPRRTTPRTASAKTPPREQTPLPSGRPFPSGRLGRRTHRPRRP